MMDSIHTHCRLDLIKFDVASGMMQCTKIGLCASLDVSAPMGLHWVPFAKCGEMLGGFPEVSLQK